MTSCAILSVVAIPILVGVMKRFGYSDIEVLISAVVFFRIMDNSYLTT